MSIQAGYCGIDVGTQGVRAVVVADDGTPLGSGARPLTSTRRTDGVHEQDPGTWWTALTGAVRRAVEQAGPDVRVVAVALDATSGTVLVEGPDGEPLGPALMYDDARAVHQAAVAQRVGADLWAALGYRMQPSWALPKLLWLQELGGAQARDRFVHQADHLVRRLVGAPVPADTSHALKSGVDLRSAAWPVDVLGELGLPLARLPEVVLPGTQVGVVGRDAAKATRLPAGAVVRAGMTDGCAAQIAAGALRSGSWSSTLGTTLVVKGSTDRLVHDPAGSVYSHRHPDGGWLPGGASSSGAGVFRDALPGRDLDRLAREAASRAVLDRAAYPLAGEGERFPFVAPHARGFEPDGLDSDVERYQALCQGIAYVERLGYDVLRGLGADVSGPVALTGGATASRWFNQLRTDVLGRPTTLPASAQAATGMAVLAAAEAGALTATAERMVRVEERLEPDAERGAALDAGYRDLVVRLADRGWLDHATATAVLDPVAGGAR